ncbi:unnamed protein product [Acanthoscelides obtectus]|uniref:Histone-lysine N-methyltransferase SETMAR n=1 Tax=Acanthoscelides obtectus TaxID=200917 RepID=A0A9P0L8T6_ACAOB|nr:unnamed protein product [Acanthoscelides obtectus]CAK1641521.1 hypothetical protein AOBTE_LOCUS12462 [Acanthoscelides obtectus]
MYHCARGIFSSTTHQRIALNSFLKNCIQMLDHPPYSHDLIPGDFLFACEVTAESTQLPTRDNRAVSNSQLINSLNVCLKPAK